MPDIISAKDMSKMNSEVVNKNSDSLVKEFCVEILEDLLNLISESQEENTNSAVAPDIVDNKTIMKNLKTLRKKPFIKEQVGEDVLDMAFGGKSD
eukprot:CAMPEP_0176340872 /NCGR_PEP_ID=MMETSP0126-20121128/1912_1 /TAXON_ID=141414 ORGANISM="Strombidinopsis acuminatum, Strain SPMC142" /NCGR_SAMPLE_ID=MMETSP0126 /ASSEMBLY_ACC=CAM_ASM_000229 /LENGTH=94 /DNA_ID=CAMNT_0017685323 /DNA_START=820 /DNA_END=1104 /DNA_ORIENTATION=-